MAAASIFDVAHAPEILLGAAIMGTGLVVFVARPRDSRNLYFAAFMGLLGLGLFASVAYLAASVALTDVLARGAWNPFAHPGGEAAWSRVVLAQRLFWIPFIADPLVLLYFASIYPQRNALHRGAVLGPFAAFALVLLAVDVFVPIPWEGVMGHGVHVGPFASQPWRGALFAYMLAAYLLALWTMGRTVAAGAGGEVAVRRSRLLLVGLAVAVLARVALVIEEMDVVTFVGPGGLLAERLAECAAALAGAWLFFHVLQRSAAPEGASDVAWARRWTLRLMAGVALFVWLPAPVAVWLGLAPLAMADANALEVMLVLLERMRYGVRWLVFGALVAYSILHYQLFDLGARARRLAADGLLAMGALILLVLALALLTRSARPLVGDDALVLLVTASVVAFAFSRAFDAARGAVHGRMAEPAPEGLRLRKLEVYRAALEDARAGRIGEVDVERLRAELRLDEAEARAVERLARAEDPTTLAPGAVVARRYLIEGRLARGGGGRVFLADDPLLGRKVVIKEVLDAGGRRVGQALREARLAGSLAHPHVVTVLDIVPRREDHLIVMEHLPGGSLQDRLDREGALPVPEALALFRGVLLGLSVVHARGIVHGDVKPGNVLLAQDGLAKIGDFGIAKVEALGTATAPGGGAPTRAWTPRYAAPEVAAGAGPTKASDVYGAARVLREMLGDAGEARAGPLAELLRRAEDADPALRPPDAAAFLRQFDAAVDGWRSALPKDEDAAPHAHEVAMPQRGPLLAGERAEVDEGPVPAARDVLDAPAGAGLQRDDGVLRRHEGVVVEADVGAPPPPHDPAGRAPGGGDAAGGEGGPAQRKGRAGP